MLKQAVSAKCELGEAVKTYESASRKQSSLSSATIRLMKNKFLYITTRPQMLQDPGDALCGQKRYGRGKSQTTHSTHQQRSQDTL